MLRKDLEDLHDNGQLGDWCFGTCDPKDQPPYPVMWLRYPISDKIWLLNYSKYWDPAEQARGELVSLPLGGDHSKHPVWQWDGNREAPTISPSIHVIGRWHGFFRNGQLETLEFN